MLVSFNKHFYPTGPYIKVKKLGVKPQCMVVKPQHIYESYERKQIKAIQTIELQIQQKIEAIHTIKLQVQQNLYIFSKQAY